MRWIDGVKVEREREEARRVCDEVEGEWEDAGEVEVEGEGGVLREGGGRWCSRWVSEGQVVGKVVLLCTNSPTTSRVLRPPAHQ